MGDPERLLSKAGGAGDLERELLESVRNVGPGAPCKDEVWNRLAAQMATAAIVGVAAASGSSAAAASAANSTAAVSVAAATKTGIGSLLASGLVAKILVVLAVVGAVAVGVGSFVAHERRSGDVAPSVSASAEAAIDAPAAVPTTSATEAIAPPAPCTATDGHPCPGSAPAASRDRPAAKSIDSTPADLLAAESKLLTEARAELRSGNASAAQTTLEHLQSQFPKGVLGQEREVLAIQVLSALGNSEAANRRAQAFIHAHPKSPHNATLRRILEPHGN